MASQSFSARQCHNKAFDRFIPYRPNLDVDAAYAQIRSSWCNTENEVPEQYINPSTRQYRKLLEEVGQPQSKRILPICERTERKHESICPYRKKQDYNLPNPSTESSFVASDRRKVPTSPEGIMDLPGIQDDYYTNVLDWSKSNILAVALHKTTYVWFVGTKNYQKIEMVSVSAPENNQYFVSALSWSPHDSALAIADNDGEITMCDVNNGKTLGECQQDSAVGVVQWTTSGILSGNAKGVVTLFDPRRSKMTGTMRLSSGKSREIIGLRQAPGTSYLASGGEDGTVDIWDLRMTGVCKSIKAHNACAKALSWCPYKSGVLATGGGSSDGYIRLWQAHIGEKLGEVFTKSQICGLLWHKDYCELVSAHGSATPEKNDLIVWKMKNMEFEPVGELRQHLARPLHIALGPDQTTVASAGADEALCLWKVFPRKSPRPAWNISVLNLFRTIR